MIQAGVKTEEYREISRHYIPRMVAKNTSIYVRDRMAEELKKVGSPEYKAFNEGITAKHYDVVVFHKGYSNITHVRECKGITVGVGKREWGASPEACFVIKVGKKYEEE